MNEERIFKKLKDVEPEIINKENIKNNILNNVKKNDISFEVENFIYILLFIISILISVRNIEIDMNFLIYNKVSFNLFYPVVKISFILSVVALFINQIFNRIFSIKEV